MTELEEYCYRNNAPTWDHPVTDRLLRFEKPWLCDDMVIATDTRILSAGRIDKESWAAEMYLQGDETTVGAERVAREILDIPASQFREPNSTRLVFVGDHAGVNIDEKIVVDPLYFRMCFWPNSQIHHYGEDTIVFDVVDVNVSRIILKGLRHITSPAMMSAVLK